VYGLFYNDVSVSYYTVHMARLIGEKCILKDLEENVKGLIEVFSRNLTEETEEDQKSLEIAVVADRGQTTSRI
jgi:hypothetical protein